MNSLCPHTLQMFEEKYCREVDPLGTRPAEWILKERALGISVSQYVGMNMVGTQKRFPPVTLKRHIWNRWNLAPETAPPSTLRMFLGLEVSHCTGNARRVRLMDLILREPMFSLLRLHFPHWEETDWGLKFSQALKSDSFEEFWRDEASVRTEVAKIVQLTLSILEHTGLSGNKFKAALLNNGRELSVTFESLKHDWAQLICDSHLTAVYAVVIDKCLQASGVFLESAACGMSSGFTALETQIAIKKTTKMTESIWLARQDQDGHQVCFEIIKKENNQSLVLYRKGLNSTLMGSLKKSRPNAWEVRDSQDQCSQKYRAYIKATQRSEGSVETMPQISYGLRRVNSLTKYLDLNREPPRDVCHVGDHVSRRNYLQNELDTWDQIFASSKH